MTQDHADKVQSSTDDAGDTLGKHLKRARLSQHKTLDEAAKAIRIHAGSLEALENDERSKLPAEVFTRGFIKIYAKYLGLDPQEALHWYDQRGRDIWLGSDEKINAHEVLASETLAESPPVITGRQLLLLAAIIIIGFLSYLGYKTYTSLPVITDVQTKPDTIREIPSIDSAPVSEDLITEPEELEGSVDASIPDDDDQKAHTEKTIIAPDTNSSPRQDSKQSTTALETPKKQASSIQQKPEDALSSPAHKEVTDNSTAQIVQSTDASITTKPPTDAQDVTFKYILKASFVEQTWLRIQIDDQPSREFTFNAADQQTWKAKEKIDLFVGNAGGINLTLNDKPLPRLGKPGKVHRLTIPKRTSN